MTIYKNSSTIYQEFNWPIVSDSNVAMLLSSTHYIPLILSAGSRSFGCALHVIQSKDFLPSGNCLLFRSIPDALTVLSIFSDIFFINSFSSCFFNQLGLMCFVSKSKLSSNKQEFNNGRKR